MGSHRRTPGTARLTVLSAAVTAAAAVTVPPAVAEPDPADALSAAERVDRLLAEAGRAVEAYNEAAERVDELREDVERHQDQLARSQQRVNDQRRTLGSAAAAHYRNGGLDPALALLLAEDPEAYLERAADLDRASTRQAGELRQLTAAHRTLERQRTQATTALGELEREQSRMAREKKNVQRKLAEARRAYHRLSDAEREERERAGRAAARPEAAALTQAAAGTGSASSPRAASAVAAARQAVGRPYAWGQNGPHGFDCSGLTQWAYAQAGTSLPRTSQAQAGAGRRVPLDQAAPGDLILYRSDASHVALYVGNGQVVHAPYPGSSVRYDPVGMMPVSSVVRPT